jgi:hypothetical protein
MNMSQKGLAIERQPAFRHLEATMKQLEIFNGVLSLVRMGLLAQKRGFLPCGIAHNATHITRPIARCIWCIYVQHEEIMVK